MKKDAAVYEMLKNGKKIAHSSFTPEEWVKYSEGWYEFEDGCMCEPREFWNFRKDESWNTGWHIVK